MLHQNRVHFQDIVQLYFYQNKIVTAADIEVVIYFVVVSNKNICEN